MNPFLDFPTPAQAEAGKMASVYGLQNHGLTNLHRVYWNLSSASLYEEIVFRGEGLVSHLGPLAVTTGKHTARAAADKFVVREQSTESRIWWGDYNRPFSAEKFSALLTRMQGFLQGRDLFVQDCYAGADPDFRMPIRIITEKAWHSLFARNLFMKIHGTEELTRHVPEFTVICAPSFQGSPIIDGSRTETFIIINFTQRLAIIGGSSYGGEIKKTIFTVLNFLLPLDGVLPMHCSANVGNDGDVALFFGLSGTGKTTLSADPSRHPIGERLERKRRLQFRGRLLRQGHSPFGGGRAADLRLYAPVRHDHGKRADRSAVAPVRPQRRHPHGKHPLRLSARLHRQPLAVENGRASAQRHPPDV